MFRNKLLRQPGSLSSLAAGGPSFYCDLSLRQMKGRANNAIKCSGTYRFYFCGGKKKAWPTSFCLLQTFGQQSSLFSNRCAIRFCNLKKNPQRIFIYSLRLKPIRHFLPFWLFFHHCHSKKRLQAKNSDRMKWDAPSRLWQFTRNLEIINIMAWRLVHLQERHAQTELKHDDGSKLKHQTVLKNKTKAEAQDVIDRIPVTSLRKPIGDVTMTEWPVRVVSIQA